MSCEATQDAPAAPAPFGTPSKPETIVATLVATNSPQLAAAEKTFFQKATIWAWRSFDVDTGVPVTNVDLIRLGFFGDDDDGDLVAEKKQPRVLAPGDELVIEAPAGQKYDLNQLYLVGTDDDGVVIEYS